MKNLFFLFIVGAGVLTFSKVSSAKEVGATVGLNLKTDYKNYCPNEGDTCIKLNTVVLEPFSSLR